MDFFKVAGHIDPNSPASWFERFCSGVASGCLKNASVQIRVVTPVAGTELLRRTKDPLPMGVKFATLGRKPAPGNFAVGGLPMELLTYQLITIFVPSQYGSLMVVDKAAVSPGVSPEVAIRFDTLAIALGFSSSSSALLNTF